MILEHIDFNKIIDECKKKGIKQPNTVYRWLRRNPTKTVDDFIKYRKSKPNSENYKYCKDNDISYNTVRQWVNRKDGRTAEDFVNRPPFLTMLCKDYNINYKAAERWLLNHKECSFDDYVRYLNKKAANPTGKIVYEFKESDWKKRTPMVPKKSTMII